MPTVNRKAILESFLDEVWNRGELHNLRHYVAFPYVIRNDPGDPWEGQKLDENVFLDRVRYSRNAFPDLHFEVLEMIEDADSVVVQWNMSGTHTGDLLQLPATGRPFRISGMTIYYFKQAKLYGHSQAFDRLGFLAQIGALNQKPLR